VADANALPTGGVVGGGQTRGGGQGNNAIHTKGERALPHHNKRGSGAKAVSTAEPSNYNTTVIRNRSAVFVRKCIHDNLMPHYGLMSFLDLSDARKRGAAPLNSLLLHGTRQTDATRRAEQFG